MARTAKAEKSSASTIQRRSRIAPNDHADHVNSSATMLDDDAHMEDSDGHSRSVESQSDAGLELLGEGMRAFVTLIQDLRDLGVEELVLPLPKICVLGDQSTGKSSLIEGISGIKLAVLNPQEDPAKFHPSSQADPGGDIQVKFSPNVVRVDISAADVPNLSFYDLPGVINQAEVREEDYLVTLVQNLVKSYIKNETCINLLAMPMTDDAANSTASRLVQELDAQHRTIGVLTKPDLLQGEESLSQWIEILKGGKFKLGHGYYVVKNNPDPRVSHSVARHEEDRFFEEVEPWARSLRSHQEHFGTLRLQGVLSKRLTAQIRTSLPQITERVRSKTAEVIARLKELPEPPAGNLSLRIYEKILDFEQELRNHFDGGSDQLPFRKEWLAAAINFRNSVAESTPRLDFTNFSRTSHLQDTLPYRSSATPISTPTAKRSHVITLESDNEDDTTQPITPTPQRKRKQQGSKSSQVSPPKRSRLEDIPLHSDAPDGSCDLSNFNRVASHAKRFTLPEIREILQDAHVGLPNQIDPKATQRMIEKSLVGWDEPLKELLAFTEQTCRAMILGRAADIFALWRGTRFFELVEEVCNAFFDEKLNQQVLWAERVLKIERQEPSTLHKATMSEARDRALRTSKAACRNARAKAFLDAKTPGWNTNLDPQAAKEKMEKVLDADLGPNPYTHELRALAVCFANPWETQWLTSW
ncbi:MAG: hypothetical protein Q9185_003510 [Variospora sp. 1 TL-2023]